MNQGTKDRTLGQRLADLQWTKYARLPAPTSDYSVTRNARIPMRDGVELLANILQPKGPASGTLLVTSPYGTNSLGSAMTGGLFASRGYRVVLVRCRGTFGSGGTFEPFMREIDDAADVVAWMREQPWFDGRFATHGYSYLGFTQWALLMDPPPELVTAVIACAPYNFGGFVYTGGAFLLSTMFEWSFVTTKQKQPILPRIFSVLSARGRIKRALATLPLADAAKELMGGKAPWYGEWISRRDLGDPWWKSADLTEALERVQVPVLLQDGWQDGFLRQTLAAHARLAGRGVNVGLSVGPWTHAQGAPRVPASCFPKPSPGSTNIWPAPASGAALCRSRYSSTAPTRGGATFRPGRRRRPSRSSIPAPANSWPLSRPTRQKSASSRMTPPSRLPRTVARLSRKSPRD
jgi:predicted acyl esterase